jgi:uncharacterized membrane protein YhhN
VAKPLTMVLLIAVALELNVSSDLERGAFVVALVFSLIGDVFSCSREQWFVHGLPVPRRAPGPWSACGSASRRLRRGRRPDRGGRFLVLGLRIIRAVRGATPELALPVSMYIGVISPMVASAIGTESVVAVVGASLFYASDALIAEPLHPRVRLGTRRHHDHLPPRPDRPRPLPDLTRPSRPR